MSGAAPFSIAPEAGRVLDRLWSEGHAAYVVGGAVRDALLGRATHDWDVATDARPERLLQLFPGSGYENRFGTVLADGVEITTFRRDHHYADHRRPDHVEFSESVVEDLARRDFTVNAIAWGRAAGAPPSLAGFVDPSEGRADLEARLLRAVGDPDRRFDEDALRLLRAARLAAGVGLTIEPRTLAAMGRHAADARWVSQERVGAELRRLVTAARPSVGLGVLASTGILAVATPELSVIDPVSTGAALDLLARTDEAHGEDEADEAMRLAILVTDLPPRGPGGARRLLSRLAIPTRTVDRVVALVRSARLGVDAAQAGDGTPGPVAIRRLIQAADAEVILQGLRLAELVAVARDDGGADALRRIADAAAAQLAAGVPTTLAQLAVDGADVMAHLDRPGGPWLGEVLRGLLDAVVEDPTRNDAATLLALASRFARTGDGEDRSIRS